MSPARVDTMGRATIHVQVCVSCEGEFEGGNAAKRCAKCRAARRALQERRRRLGIDIGRSRSTTPRAARVERDRDRYDAGGAPIVHPITGRITTTTALAREFLMDAVDRQRRR